MVRPGDLLFDRYELLTRERRIAGIDVYLARDTSDGRQVRLKISPRWGDSELDECLPLEREFRVLSRLSHAGVPHVIDYVSDCAGLYGLCLDCPKGLAPLGVCAVEHSPADWFARWFDGLLDVLQYVHGLGFVHGSLTPASVLGPLPELPDSGFPTLVSDFFDVRETRDAATSRPADDWFFLPPGAHPSRGGGTRVDLYSSGALAVHVLSGQLAATPVADPLDVLHSNCSGLPGPVSAVLERMLSKDASLRPRSVEEVRDQLAHVGLAGFRSPQPLNRSSRECAVVPSAAVVRRIQSAFARARVRAAGLLILVGPRGSGKTSSGALVKIEAKAQGWAFCEATTRLPAGDAAIPAACVRREGDPEQVTARARAGILPSSDARIPPSSHRVYFADDIDLLGEQDLASVLELVRARSEHERVLLVASCREVPLALVKGWPVGSSLDEYRPGLACGRDLILDVCRLEGFARDETSQLVAEVLGARPSAELVGWIHRQTGGDPLLTRELTSHLVGQGKLCLSVSGLSLDAPSLEGHPLETGTAVLHERFAELPGELRSVAAVVSLGPGVTAAAVSRVMGTSADQTQYLLADLCARGLLLPVSSVDEDVVYSHELLKDAAYDCQDAESRRSLHGRLAAYWASPDSPVGRGESRDQVLAWHLSRGETPSLALPYALQACSSLAEAGRVEESLCYLEVIEGMISSQVGTSSGDVDCLLSIVRAYWRHGRAAACARACRTSMSLRACREVPPPAQMEFLWNLGRALVLSGQPATADIALRDALQVARSLGNAEWLARIHSGLCMACQMRGDLAESASLAADAIAMVDETAPAGLLSTCYNAQGNALLALCRWRDAKPWYAKAAESAALAKEIDKLSTTTCNLGLAHLNLGEWSEAERCFDEALVPARAQGCAYSMALALNNSGILWMRRGALDEAGNRLWEAVKWFEECGDNWGLALAYSNIGELEHIRGNDHAAQDLFSRSEELMSTAGSIDDLPELYRRQGESLTSLGEREDAVLVLERARTMAAKMGNCLEVANCTRALGELAAHDEAGSKAAALCEEAIESLRALGAQYELARSLAALGHILAGSGASERAAASLEEARDILTGLGARRELRALQEEMAAVSGVSRPLVKHLPDERGRLAALYRSSASLAAADSMDALASELADIMAANVPADVAAVVLLHPDGGVGATISSMCEHRGDTDAVGSLVSVLLAALPDDPPVPQLLDVRTAPSTLAPLLRARGLRRVLVAPMVSAKRRIGALYLDYRNRDGLFSEQDVRFIEALGAQAATAIENVQLRGELVDEIESLRWEVDGRYSFANIIGRSLQMQRLFSLLQKVSRSSVTVLVEGESGTGKELVARAIHFNGSRKKARFIAQNCAALPEQLLESELFGHVRGAFTGALRDKPGLFEAADCGTFFLDEIADMPSSLQVKLLRVLQDGEIRRVGATDPVTVDVRIVAATNKSLEDEVKAGRFREDLYYRLNVVRVVMPPLRERRDDIPLLAQHFLNRFAGESSETPRGFTDHAMELLVNYGWPGNVRELENELQRAVALARPGTAIGASALSDRIRSVQVAIRPLRPGSQLSLKDMVEDVERRVILQVLNEHDWNKSRASEALGLSRQGLLKKIARFGLEQAEE
jgi:transcriptional regulator with GAF, ATPase, and Fis domain